MLAACWQDWRQAGHARGCRTAGKCGGELVVGIAAATVAHTRGATPRTQNV